MKKLFVIIIFFLLMLGCESGVKYEYDIIKNVGVNVISDQDIILIDSHEELTEVFNSERFYTSSVELREKADFDSSYFEDYYLILIFINVQDLLTSYSLKSVQVNNDVLTIVIKAEILNNELVACVTAEDDSENYKTLYLLIIKGTSNKYQVKIEEFVNRIMQEGKKITTLKLKGDIACRGHMTVYDGQNFDKTEEYYVYCKGEPEHTTDNRLMPMAVFEAVKCNDFQEAKYYLTDSLNEILTPEKLEEFFGEYYEIIPNSYYSQYPHSFLLIDGNNTATLFNTVYKNNKIDNFTEIEF